MKLVCLVFKKYFKEIHVGFIFLKDHVTIPYGDSIACAQRIFFEILLDQNEIRLYLQFSDQFGTKRTSYWFQINQNMVHTI